MNKFVFVLPIFLIFLLGFGFAFDTCQEDNICLSGGCQTITLTAKQVQSIWDNFLYKAIKPEKILAGKAALQGSSEDAKKCTNSPKVNTISKDNKLGAEVDLGCETLEPDSKSPFFKERCVGDYAVGMLLDTSMRMARCQGNIAANKNEQCSVYDKALRFSNAETGLELVSESLSGLWNANNLTSDFTKKDAVPTEEFLKKTTDITNSAAPDPNAKISGSDFFSFFDSNNDVNGKVPKRTEQKEKISNHIETKTFVVNYQDICEGQDAADRCKIYIYSFFDRYYNSYYSGSLIVATFGPAVYGIGKKHLPQTVKDKWAKYISDPAAKLKMAAIGNSHYEKAAIEAAENLRNSGVFSGMKASELKDFEKLFNEGSSDKIRQSFEGFVKNLDTVEKRQAYLKYLTAKSNYAKSFGAELSGLEGDSAAKFLIAQDKKAEAMGTSLIDTFYEKNPQYNKYFYLDNETSKGYVALSDKAAKENVLSNSIKGKKNLNPDHLFTANKYEPLTSGAPGPQGLKAFIESNPNKIYVVDVGGAKRQVVASNVDEIVNQFSNYQFIPLQEAKDFAPITNTSSVIKEMQSGFKKIGEKASENVAARSDDLTKLMYDRNLVDKKYWNLLNWQLYNQKLSWQNNKLRMAVNWTVMPQIYWMIKTKDGSPWKAYFVNEKSMSNVKISPGETPTYNDAYIDFFANQKFSSGDFFGEVIVKNIADLIGSIFPDGDIEKNLFNFAGIKTRDDVKNIVYWTSTKECTNCVLQQNLKEENKRVSVDTSAKSDTVNYILEYPDVANARVGLSLASFTHHTNIEFNLNGTNKENSINDVINIDAAKADKNTCSDKVKTSVFGGVGPIGEWFEANSSRVGLAMGIIDNAGFYAMNALLPGFLGIASGMLGTYIADSHFTDHFDGCVDADEGYYIHYVHRFEDQSQKQGVLEGLVSQGQEVGNTKVEDKVNDKITNTINEIKNKFVNLVQNKDKEFLQVEFDTVSDPTQDTSGLFNTPSLFMVWVKGDCDLTGEDKESLMVAIGKDKDGKEQKLAVDKSNNTISLNGNVFLQSDLVALAKWNGIFNGYEIPQSSTFIPADLGVDYFEFLPNGDYKILDSSTEMCFISGCQKQTGFNYSNPLQFTGAVTGITTKQAGTITPNGNSFLIKGGVTERHDIQGSVIVDANIHVSNIDKFDLGLLAAVQFQKAVMIYRETQKDFVLWIRIIAQINGKDVQRFWATPKTIQNPETGCDEQAFDLSVLGNQNDLQAKEKGEEFNQALQHAGPFQYFETSDGAGGGDIIMFYSKREANGQCKKYMKIVDKKTGQVKSDSAITSFTTNPDGSFSIGTEDGKTHTLDFSNEGGVPYLTLDGKKNPLIMAQGRNGSFYFNPDTGEWTVGNSQMLPFSDKFSQGRLTTGDGTTVPGANPIYKADTSVGKSGSWNIPLFDGNEKYYLIALSSLVAIGIIYLSLFKK